MLRLLEIMASFAHLFQATQFSQILAVVSHVMTPKPIYNQLLFTFPVLRMFFCDLMAPSIFLILNSHNKSYYFWFI